MFPPHSPSIFLEWASPRYFISKRRTTFPHPLAGSPVSEALHLDIFHQPLRCRFFDSLKSRMGDGTKEEDFSH